MSAPTFATAAHDVLDAPGLRPATVRTYRNAFKLATPLHGRKVNRVTRRHVEECLQETVGMGYAPKSVKCLLDFIRAVLRRNGSQAADCIRFPVPQRPPRALREGDHTALRTALEAGHSCGDAAATGLLVLMGTGLRVGELVSLRGSNWDAPCRILHVVDSTEGPAKSGKFRAVEVPKWAAHAVDAWIGSAVSERKLRRTLARFCRAVGIDASLQLHDLRHTRASRLLMAGAPVLWVSKQLGHSSPGFTLNTYGHLIDQESWADLA